MGTTLARAPGRDVHRPGPHREHAHAGTGSAGGGAIGRLLQLQRTAGNSATTTALQRADGPGAPLTHPLLAGNSRVVRAAAGETLHPGGDRGAIAVMQQALEQVGFPPANSKKPDGSMDGGWGSGTSAAVGSFQGSVGIDPQRPSDAGPKTFHALDDELNKGGGGGGGGDIVPPIPPDNELRNVKLEDMMDQTLLAYDKMLVKQTRGLSRLEADLREPEKARKSLTQEALQLAAELVLKGVLGQADTGLRAVALAAAAAKGVIGEGLDKGVTTVFDEAHKAAKDKVSGEITPERATIPLSGWVSAQQVALTESHLALHETFIGQTKPALRDMDLDMTLKFLENPLVDPRLERAQGVLDAARAAEAKAEDEQYLKGASGWASANARSVLGSTGFGNDTVTNVEALKEHDSAPGVLEVEIDVDEDRPSAPVVVTELRVAGLSLPVRTKLMERGTIGALGMPARADGDGFHISRSESQGDVHGADTMGDDELRYLEAKGGSLNQLVGIREMWKEIDRTPLSQVPLQGPKGLFDIF